MCHAMSGIDEADGPFRFGSRLACLLTSKCNTPPSPGPPAFLFPGQSAARALHTLHMSMSYADVCWRMVDTS
eukprot:3664893-Rhodomonas_salina.2